MHLWPKRRLIAKAAGEDYSSLLKGNKSVICSAENAIPGSSYTQK